MNESQYNIIIKLLVNCSTSLKCSYIYLVNAFSDMGNEVVEILTKVGKKKEKKSL